MLWYPQNRMMAVLNLEKDGKWRTIPPYSTVGGLTELRILMYSAILKNSSNVVQLSTVFMLPLLLTHCENGALQARETWYPATTAGLKKLWKKKNSGVKHIIFTMLSET